MSPGSGGQIKVLARLVSPWLAGGCLLPMSAHVFSLGADAPGVPFSFYKDTGLWGFTLFYKIYLFI